MCFFVLRLKHMFKQSLKLLLRIPNSFKAFQVVKWFLFFNLNVNLVCFSKSSLSYSAELRKSISIFASLPSSWLSCFLAFCLGQTQFIISVKYKEVGLEIRPLRDFKSSMIFQSMPDSLSFTQHLSCTDFSSQLSF